MCQGGELSHQSAGLLEWGDSWDENNATAMWEGEGSTGRTDLQDTPESALSPGVTAGQEQQSQRPRAAGRGAASAAAAGQTIR